MEDHLLSIGQLRERGNVLPIRRWGDPILHRATQAVSDFDAGLLSLVADLLATNKAANGAGLAAPQIGSQLALFAYDCVDADNVRRSGVICNPVLTLPEGAARRLERWDEGCLSLPGAWATLARPDRAICAGQDHYGEEVVISGTGLLARCLQHEYDHLQGTVFGDRLPLRIRKKLYADHHTVQRTYPPDWPA